MITNIPEYMLHYQLEYLEEQNCLKIYNKNITKTIYDHCRVLFPWDPVGYFCPPFLSIIPYLIVKEVSFVRIWQNRGFGGCVNLLCGLSRKFWKNVDCNFIESNFRLHLVFHLNSGMQNILMYVIVRFIYSYIITPFSIYQEMYICTHNNYNLSIARIILVSLFFLSYHVIVLIIAHIQQIIANIQYDIEKKFKNLSSRERRAIFPV